MAKLKAEKKEETLEDWVKRINKKSGKTNGLKRHTGHHHSGK